MKNDELKPKVNNKTKNNKKKQYSYKKNNVQYQNQNYKKNYNQKNNRNSQNKSNKALLDRETKLINKTTNINDPENNSNILKDNVNDFEKTMKLVKVEVELEKKRNYQKKSRNNYSKYPYKKNNKKAKVNDKKIDKNKTNIQVEDSNLNKELLDKTVIINNQVSIDELNNNEIIEKVKEDSLNQITTLETNEKIEQIKNTDIIVEDNHELKSKVEKSKEINSNEIKISKKKKEKKCNKKVIDFENEVVFVNKKKKNKKLFVWLILIIVIILLVFLGIFGYLKYCEEQELKHQEAIRQEQLMLKEMIASHYNEFVIIKEDSVLYQIDENNNYYEYGMVYKGQEVSLDEIEIDHLTKYFYSSELDAYLEYKALEPIDSLKENDDRYKKYIPFNKNVITKNEFSLYEDDHKVYSFKESMSFPIIINNYDGKYYVEFNNRLLYVLKDDINEIVSSSNTKQKNASKITTLCYHRVYDTHQKCNDISICKKKSSFDKEMKYLKDNNYFSLTMEESYLYLSKKIQVPKNSVIITMDDGHLFKNAIEILEKYGLRGTGFVTGKITDLTPYESPNFEVHSHTEKMHKAGVCQKQFSYQQGGGILCLPEKTVLNDLKTSRERLNNAIALAYPFYDFNDRAVNLVKKAGFKIAFIGAGSTVGRSYPGINLYKVPRITMWDNTSFETFKSYVKN